LVVLFLHLAPFFVVPAHCCEVADAFFVVLPAQQFVPTVLLWILHTQLFDLLRLHFMQSN
jgi:hypothetical protein